MECCFCQTEQNPTGNNIFGRGTSTMTENPAKLVFVQGRFRYFLMMELQCQNKYMHTYLEATTACSIKFCLVVN